MRPAIRAGLLPVWRDRNTVQIGIDPRRAVALTGMAGAAELINLLDGSRERETLLATAAGAGIPAALTEQVLTLLATSGALIDASTGLPVDLRRRYRAELATASLAHGHCDGGARAVARRRAAVVWLGGDKKLARAIARVLARAGIGRLRLGLPPTGERAKDGVRPRPDLVILAGHQPRPAPDQLVAGRLPHLAVTAGEAIGVIGPLVLPGQSACLRCLHYARAGMDPAWPLILAQLASRQPDPPACDAALTALVAAQAAVQVLNAIDTGPAQSPLINGTLEVTLPGWRWRRRSWQPHPACLCASSAPHS
jgi:bacteriocin biosynthesis cyclodehydratase domain-containing protein